MAVVAAVDDDDDDDVVVRKTICVRHAHSRCSNVSEMPDSVLLASPFSHCPSVPLSSQPAYSFARRQQLKCPREGSTGTTRQTFKGIDCSSKAARHTYPHCQKQLRKLILKSAVAAVKAVEKTRTAMNDYDTRQKHTTTTDHRPPSICADKRRVDKPYVFSNLREEKTRSLPALL